MESMVGYPVFNPRSFQPYGQLQHDLTVNKTEGTTHCAQQINGHIADCNPVEQTSSYVVATLSTDDKIDVCGMTENDIKTAEEKYKGQMGKYNLDMMELLKDNKNNSSGSSDD